MSPTIVVVGAGSAAFGLAAIKGLTLYPPLEGCRLVLHDVDPEALARAEGVARLLLAQSRTQNRAADREVVATTDRSRALDGADCVVLSITSNREDSWQREREIALKHGINHYAENGGPAAIFHTARNLALIMPVLRDMERLCPHAWVLNYTNPVPRIGTAIARYTRLRSLGVCHQLGFGYYMSAVLLAEELGIPLPKDYLFRWNDASLATFEQLMEVGQQRSAIHASGLNHFTWAHAVVDRRTGRDLYPHLRAANAAFDPTFEPLTRRLFSRFDRFPIPGDCHIVEYLPYAHSVTRDSWNRLNIQMYDFHWSKQIRLRRASLAGRVVRERNLSLLDGIVSERVEPIAAALLGRSAWFDESLNLPNGQAVPGLPPEAIVEVPVTIGPTGVLPVACPPHPLAVQELLRRQAAICELSVAGTVEGNRDLLLQALSLDPMVDDIDLPEALLDHYAKEFEPYV